MMQQALTGPDSLADNIVHGNRAGGKTDKNTKISSHTTSLTRQAQVTVLLNMLRLVSFGQ